MNQQHAFYGCIPALMTPCSESGTPDFNALVRKGKELIGLGMSSVVYCGSMGDWPLLSEEQRQQGVAALVMLVFRSLSVLEPKTPKTRFPMQHMQIPAGPGG